MSPRICARCRQPYGEAIEGVINVAPSYAPFCSKRCADVDLVHWLKGDYIIDDTGSLGLTEDEPAVSPIPPSGEDEA